MTSVVENDNPNSNNTHDADGNGRSLTSVPAASAPNKSATTSSYGTLVSLLQLLHPSEFFVTVDHSVLWQRHIAWSKPKGEELRQYVTQRYASNMVFLSCMLAAEINVFFNSSRELTDMRSLLSNPTDLLFGGSTHGSFSASTVAADSELTDLMMFHKKLRYGIGWIMLVNVSVTVIALVTTFTLWGMVSSISDANTHALLRSSIGQYVTSLPSRFTVGSLYLFLLWILGFIVNLVHGWIPCGILVVLVLSMFFQVVIPLSCFGRLIIHCGAMAKRPVLDEELERELLPSGLHASLLIRATDRRRKYSCATDQYRKQNLRHYYDSNRSSAAGSRHTSGTGGNAGGNNTVGGNSGSARSGSYYTNSNQQQYPAPPPYNYHDPNSSPGQHNYYGSYQQSGHHHKRTDSSSLLPPATITATIRSAVGESNENNEKTSDNELNLQRSHSRNDSDEITIDLFDDGVGEGDGDRDGRQLHPFHRQQLSVVESAAEEYYDDDSDTPADETSRLLPPSNHFHYGGRHRHRRQETTDSAFMFPNASVLNAALSREQLDTVVQTAIQSSLRMMNSNNNDTLEQQFLQEQPQDVETENPTPLSGANSPVPQPMTSTGGNKGAASVGASITDGGITNPPPSSSPPPPPPPPPPSLSQHFPPKFVPPTPYPPQLETINSRHPLLATPSPRQQQHKQYTGSSRHHRRRSSGGVSFATQPSPTQTHRPRPPTPSTSQLGDEGDNNAEKPNKKPSHRRRSSTSRRSSTNLGLFGGLFSTLSGGPNDELELAEENAVREVFNAPPAADLDSHDQIMEELERSEGQITGDKNIAFTSIQHPFKHPSPQNQSSGSNPPPKHRRRSTPVGVKSSTNGAMQHSSPVIYYNSPSMSTDVNYTGNDNFQRQLNQMDNSNSSLVFTYSPQQSSVGQSPMSTPYHHGAPRPRSRTSSYASIHNSSKSKRSLTPSHYRRSSLPPIMSYDEPTMAAAASAAAAGIAATSAETSTPKNSNVNPNNEQQTRSGNWVSAKSKSMNEEDEVNSNSSQGGAIGIGPIAVSSSKNDEYEISPYGMNRGGVPLRDDLSPANQHQGKPGLPQWIPSGVDSGTSAVSATVTGGIGDTRGEITAIPSPRESTGYIQGYQQGGDVIRERFSSESGKKPATTPSNSSGLDISSSQLTRRGHSSVFQPDGIRSNNGSHLSEMDREGTTEPTGDNRNMPPETSQTNEMVGSTRPPSGEGTQERTQLLAESSSRSSIPRYSEPKR